jgi:hypothetical protein
MIIASIVSIPGRLESLIFVLNALLKQSILPDYLYVSISNYYPRSKKYYPGEHLQYLKEFLSNYSIPNKLVTYENDIGPTLKLITPLKENFTSVVVVKDEDFIFTFDDDTPLYERTIETLLQAYKKNKNAVYSFSGTREERFLHAEFLPEDYDYFEIDVLGGYRGVLYPVHLIDKIEFYNWVDMFISSSNKQGLIAMHDDHIFSYYFKYKSIPRRVSNSPFNKTFIYTPISNDDGIFNDSNTNSSIKVLRDTLFENNLGWVVTNPF